MYRDKTCFLNLYKFICSILIACFLHYTVFLLGMTGEKYEFEIDSGIMRFLLSDDMNAVVEGFFVMSGFVFAFAYFDKIEQGALSFPGFIEKRIGRFLPLSVITTTAFFFLQTVSNRLTGLFIYPGGVSLNSYISSLFLFNTTLIPSRTNAPGWYIAKLLICYCLAWGLSKVHGYIGKITFFLPVMIGIIIQSSGLDVPFLEYHVARGYIAFFIGIILGRALPKLRGRQIFYAVVGSVVAIATVFIFRGYITDRGLIASTMIFPELVTIGFFSKKLNYLCNNRLVTWLGEISFDLYLWNVPLLLAIWLLYFKCHFTMNQYPMLVLIIVLHIIAGGLSVTARKKIKDKMQRAS